MEFSVILEAILAIIIIIAFFCIYSNTKKIKRILEYFYEKEREKYRKAKQKDTKWKCPKCSFMNTNDTYHCKECGYKLI